MIEIIFLFSLALIWITFASIQDLKTRIVYNWISFSLIVFALGFRLFYSFFTENFGFFYHGLIGFGIFFVIGNMLYYGRMFAGGDAKMMIALGAVLPTSTIFSVNLNYFSTFLISFIFIGGFYGIGWSVYLAAKNLENFNKEYRKQIKKSKSLIYLSLLFGAVLIIFGFFEVFSFYFAIFIFLLPLMFIYARAVDEACMVRKVKTRELVEGDWLYKNVKIGKKTITSGWHGLSEEEIKMIRKKYRTIKIKEGIPFVPVFFFSFLLYFVITVFFSEAASFFHLFF